MPPVNKFKDLMSAYASKLNWTTITIDEESAEFEFNASSGEFHTLLVTLQEDELVEFDIPSAGVFEHEEEVPGDISTLLLKRNMLLPLGAWALEEFSEEWAYSLIWNLPLAELETLPVETVGENVKNMLEEVDEFDEMWDEEQ